jgi:hypothetical protein
MYVLREHFQEKEATNTSMTKLIIFNNMTTTLQMNLLFRRFINFFLGKTFFIQRLLKIM